MSRKRVSEVCCNYCGDLIGFYNFDVNKSIVEDGGIIYRHRDFCKQECVELWISNGKKGWMPKNGSRKD
jgi:hypothetical protein